MTMEIASQQAIWFSLEKVSLTFRFTDFENLDNSIRILYSISSFWWLNLLPYWLRTFKPNIYAYIVILA